ncbi:MAG: hypothetical protein CVV27_03340 [Candidatus Melainabacteria bacterium HGW-Melainabacteria-1]|nr:MAG: hypothetical protein CVV27_03340 [Candidatus Melainabacteria bacterium HGW-Melainabacteria-1]
MFSKFFKKSAKPSSEPGSKPGSDAPFPFFESKQELAGLEATTRKRELEARQQELELLAQQTDLSPEQTAELQLIQAEIAELLQVGSTRDVPKPNTKDVTDWIQAEETQANILLIEDDPDVYALLSYLLSYHRFEVTHLNSGLAARDWILSHLPVDLISLDIMLPNLDGLELIATIRRQPGWEQVPIMMLTSKSDDATIQRALQLGANGYLVKPFQPEEYLTRVKHLLKAD